jgi:hypothetical protein
MPGTSSQLATAHVAAARQAVLTHFNAPDGSKVIFTANASQALKLVGEAFPFGSGYALPFLPYIFCLHSYTFRSSLLLPEDAHNSVHGIREFARRAGASVAYMPVRSGRGGTDVAKAGVSIAPVLCTKSTHASVRPLKEASPRQRPTLWRARACGVHWSFERNKHEDLVDSHLTRNSTIQSLPAQARGELPIIFHIASFRTWVHPDRRRQFSQAHHLLHLTFGSIARHATLPARAREGPRLHYATRRRRACIKFDPRSHCDGCRCSRNQLLQDVWISNRRRRAHPRAWNRRASARAPQVRRRRPSVVRGWYRRRRADTWNCRDADEQRRGSVRGTLPFLLQRTHMPRIVVGRHAQLPPTSVHSPRP